MHAVALANFPGAGPQGSAGEQGARVHLRPSVCLCPHMFTKQPGFGGQQSH